MKEHCILSDEREAVVFEELLYCIRSIIGQLSDVLGHLEKLGVRRKSQRDVERFTALYNAFHNTMRTPCNRGYSPDGLMQMIPPKE